MLKPDELGNVTRKNISRLMRYHTCGFIISLARALFRDARERAVFGKIRPSEGLFRGGARSGCSSRTPVSTDEMKMKPLSPSSPLREHYR